MARIYADSSGNILQILPTWEVEQAQDTGIAPPAFPAKPANPAPTYTLQFDEATNASLLAALQASATANTFSMPGGTLTQKITSGGTTTSGQAVINPPSGLYSLYLIANPLVAQLEGGVGMTPAQQAMLTTAFLKIAGVVFSG